MAHVLAVDGNSLAHRAFHATAEEERSGGFLAGGLVRMVATTWPEGPFDGVLVGFDDPSHNRRREQFAGYKAHREDKPPALRQALQRLPEDLAACGLQVVPGPTGAEADDVLAAAARTATEQDLQLSLLSSDRDLTALVSASVTLLRPRGSMARLKAYRPADVLAEYGVEAEQYREFAALRGDTSDGLDGVRGVGPKTAARLLGDYGSVAGIYAALHLLPPRLEATLRAGRERVRRNLELMAPLEDVTVRLDPCLDGGLDLDLIEQVLDGLGLPRAAATLRRMVTSPPPPLPPPPAAPPPQERQGPREHRPAGPLRPASPSITADPPATQQEATQASLF